MNKKCKVATALVVAVVFCFASVGVAEALGPIWKIFKAGTNQSITWKTHNPNPRFAKWKAGTNGDTSDDIILDRETGLVWERTPDTTERLWKYACSHCETMSKGGRGGWRLPTLIELMTLVDKNNVTPALPDGNPFIGIYILGSYHYWTSTTSRWDSDDARIVDLSNGFLGSYDKEVHSMRTWCVRGGSGYDANW